MMSKLFEIVVKGVPMTPATPWRQEHDYAPADYELRYLDRIYTKFGDGPWRSTSEFMRLLFPAGRREL